ncbi:hypothetical protein GZ78_28265 [Endozoicomonas numazuensis]|uniref:Uncharacterized protein n=2 Tax=Endozoicomonas numazuensis TaxID=1137799 RepID=A0A081N108_9GAMM|nr:hypothetical protein GZ78_28265 [Endozoicomonas numazuensis]
MGIAFIFSILSQARSIAFFSICSCNVPDQQQTIFQGKIVSLNSLVRITTPAIALFLSNGISAGDLLVLFSTINVIVAVALYWSTLNLVRESSGNILVSIVTHLPKGYPWKALFITYYRCVQTIIVTTVSAEWLLLDNYQQASFNFVLMGVAVTMVGVLMVYNCRNIPEIPVLVIYSLLLVLFLVLKANAWLVFVTLFLYTLYESILASKIKIMATPDDAPYFASWFQWSTGMGMIIGYVAVIINPDFFQTGNLFFILPVAVAGCLIAVILRTESFRIS